MNMTPDRAQTSDKPRNRRSALIALAVAFAFLMVVVVVGSDVLNCSPPSRQELKTQEAFVLERLNGARDIRSSVADCDDNGDGYVDFTTDLSATAARDAFVADKSCSPYAQDGDEPSGVQCRSGESTVFVFFTADAAEDTTAGELTFS